VLAPSISMWEVCRRHQVIAGNGLKVCVGSSSRSANDVIS
jgi:hypothetical protein